MTEPTHIISQALPGISGGAPGSRVPVSSVDGATTLACPCGRFLILRRHAEGGLGVVSVALDESLHRRVALKQMRPELAGNAAARLRFIHEAQIAGQLEHPGIVPVYAFGQDEDARPYYVMRFVEGGTLDEAIASYHARPDPLAFNDLLRRFVHLSRIVAYAHSQGVIHRDLKPQNVLVGMYGETILLDWGLAKRLATEAAASEAEPSADGTSRGVLTESGNPLGTPAYMAPEQAAGNATGASADIYSLGAILYEILTGRPPYTEGLAQDVLKALASGPPARPSTVRRGVWRELEAVCLKAMSRRHQDRYEHADYIAAEIDRFLAGQPVEAYAYGPFERAMRWVRVHSAPVMAAAAILVLALLATIMAVLMRGCAGYS